MLLLCINQNSLIPMLEISDELILIDKNNISTGELSKDQINRLLRLMTSWIDVMQKEIDLIKDIKVPINNSQKVVRFFSNI